MNDSTMDALNRLYLEAIRARDSRMNAAETLRRAEMQELKAVEKLRIATEQANRKVLVLT